MDWFAKIFGKLGSGNSSHTTVDVADHEFKPEVDVVPRDLFLEETPPEQEPPKHVTADTSVKRFMERDFFRIGYDDGYDTHSNEILGINRRKIRADFRFAIEQLIDEIRRQALLLKGHLVDAGSISESIRDQLQLRIDELKSRLDYLEKEKELSIEDEGLVSVAIHKYHDGFVRGVHVYEEEKVFAASTGLFN